MSSMAASGGKHQMSPVWAAVLGLAILAFWVMAVLLQIQTSEAFILNAGVVTLKPNMAVFMQIPNLFMGNTTVAEAQATMWGWGIELIYLVCVIGYSVAHEAVGNANRKATTWFRTVAFLLVGFDSYMDFKFGNLASGLWGQIGFSVLTAFAVAFFGVIGFHLLKFAWAEFSA